MTFQDYLTFAIGNLRRMKLRAFLTISGVVIAIGAFVAMLSFGAGMQKQVDDQFDKLGLFTTMQVYPKRDSDKTDSTKAAILDDAAVSMLSRIPGVRLAYPFEDFDVTVTFADSQITTEAQALSVEAAATRLYSQIEAGKILDSDSAQQVMVTTEFAEMFGIEDSDSLVGREVILSISVASLDSGLAHILKENDEFVWKRLSDVRFDSLRFSGYRNRILNRELGGAASRFIDGFLNARQPLSDTLTIVGVMKTTGRRSRTVPMIIPIATARRFNSAGFSGSMPELLASLSQGNIFPVTGEEASRSYSRVTLDLQHDYPYSGISDSIKTLGYRVFSYAEEFEEIRQFFTFFYLGLGVVGFIALSVASLGIINTMVMSITERRREIGVLRSLGADAADIRMLFLSESAIIGSIGAAFGILLGWLVSRAISFGAGIYMEQKGLDPVDMFTLPLWLIATAFLFGLFVSLAAGYYPASRAARVDPVQALRGE